MNGCEIAKNDFEEDMSIQEYYAKIVELSARLIAQHGYKRSGNSGIFYRYNSNKSKGYLIGFRKSLDNTPDFCTFYILFGSVCIGELSNLGVYRNNVTLQDLKSILMNGYHALSNCHKLDDYIIQTENINDYFINNISNELKSIIKELAEI